MTALGKVDATRSVPAPREYGAIGRRAVTVEHLQYNADGSMKPVVQSEAGISVPPAQ